MATIKPRLFVVAPLLALFATSVVPTRAASPVIYDGSHGGQQARIRVSSHVYAVGGHVVNDSVNGLLDCDMAIYVTNSSTYTSLAAEGHLELKPSGGGYSGSFTDDLGAAKRYPAKATGVSTTTLDGHYVVNTHNGKFSFVVGATFMSKVPKKYGRHSKIATILYGVHAYTPQTPLQVSIGSFTIGGLASPATGTLNLTTDAIGYIVPFSKRLLINSSFAYTLSGGLKEYAITSYGRYYPPDGAGDGSLTTILQVGKHTFNIIDAKEDTSGQRIISGNALSGYGPNTIQASFSAH